MKKIILTAAAFALVANASAQLKVDANGDTRIFQNIYMESASGIFGTTDNNVPITFKVNGLLAGYTGSSIKYNVSFGYGALNSQALGGNNTAMGYQALYSNTRGSANTATGYNALYFNTTGMYNTANGFFALYFNETGNYNTANGWLALYSNTTGDYNTATGMGALQSNTTGAYNTATGYDALYDNTTGNYNTAIGYYAYLNANNLNNATAIGYYATVTGSNQVRIGNTSVTSIGGYADWTKFSDNRANKNIRADVPGLDFINLLQPVTYNLDLDAMDSLLKADRTEKGDKEEEYLQPDTYSLYLDNANGLPNIDKPKIPDEDELPQELKDINKKAREAKEKQLQTGFIAQDVEATAKSIGYDFSGVDVDEAGIYGLRYAEFVVPLVKAVQELSEQNDRLQAQVHELAELVYSLQGKDAAPSATTPKSKSTGESGTGLQVLAGASLQQNVPNPFSQSTVIRYTLPQACASAQLVVTATSGQAVRQIPLSCSGGAGSIAIEGGALPAGSYFYSLYVDGTLIDTKQMILTK
ncbi:MAG: tail fiber domain-containing protein [Prevotellaceae bacterium]|jgi:hypothetical protein|nr:tail fiber domain-containing protein [Prevotellaceae bacterium]